MEQQELKTKDQHRRSPRYTVTLSGSQASVATYGVVEFLRGKWYLRGLVAAIGIAGAILYAASFTGLKLPGASFGILFFFLFTPYLLWIATISGDDFQVVFPEQQASKERQQAEQQFEVSNAPEDALTLDMKRLNEYYTINQSQARSSFRWAIFTSLLGFTTIVAGIWIFYLGNTETNVFMAALSTAAGCIVNLVAGLFLYLHNKTQERSLFYYQQLSQLQRVAMAIRLVDAHSDNILQAEARNLVISQLLNNLNTSNITLESLVEQKSS